jgi:hypothetical protein
MHNDRPRGLILTGELPSWELQLVNDEVIRLKAHAYSHDRGTYVFVALMEGTPRYEIELARIPVNLVKNIRGG